MATEWLNVSDTRPRIAYTVGATPQSLFAIPFIFFENGDINVYVDGVKKTLSTHYTLSGAFNEFGGAMTLLSPVSNAKVVIARNITIELQTHIPTFGPLDIPAINIQFSRFVAIQQELADRFSRSLILSDASGAKDLTLPDPAAGMYLRWKTDLTGLENAIPSVGDGVADTRTDFATRTIAIAATIDGGIRHLRTAGYTNVGDGGGGLYKRVATAPSHSARFRSADRFLPNGATDNTNGGWWELDFTSGIIWAAQLGAVPDEGVTNNLTAIQAAIDLAGWRGTVYLSSGVYNCSAAPTNPKGVHIRGQGYITIPAADGYASRWDQRGTQYELITGKEYLSAWHNVARGGAISSAKLEFLGDSTTAGAAITDSNYLIDKLVKDNFLAMGSGINPQFINRGVGGATTEDIRTVQVPAAIADAPHLIVLRPGHNDIYSRLGAPGPKTNAQIEAAAELVRVSLDASLASIRSSYGHLRLSVVLMTPNSASLSLDGRDERYYETLSPMYRQLARKYKCCFVDTYRIWRDSRDMNTAATVGQWLDVPYGATNGGIHPLEAFNLQIADVLTDLLMPRTLARIVSPASGSQVATPGLQSGWSAASGQVVTARRQGQVVQIEGLINPGTTSASTVLLSLPAGMRPSRRRWFGCTTVLDTTACNVARVYVETNGNVVLQFWPTSSTAMGLDDICFLID